MARLKDDINHVLSIPLTALTEQLTVDDFLPPCMFTPRQKSVDVETSEQNSEMEISKDSKFRKNALAVLVKLESYGIAFLSLSDVRRL